MRFEIQRQESYSRGELLLRSFFGWLYIAVPHGFLLLFFALWGMFLSFLAFWVILFTGSYPRSMFEYQVRLIRWNMRVNATLSNLIDGYPAFGLDGTNDQVEFDIAYPETTSRGLTLIRQLFGIVYCGIPHFFILYFRMLATVFLQFIAWWVVLFTGEYPESWHRFNVGTLRWAQRVSLYLGHMCDQYPPFSGRSDQELYGTDGITDQLIEITEDENNSGS